MCVCVDVSVCVSPVPVLNRTDFIGLYTYYYCLYLSLWCPCDAVPGMAYGRKSSFGSQFQRAQSTMAVMMKEQEYHTIVARRLRERKTETHREIEREQRETDTHTQRRESSLDY